MKNKLILVPIMCSFFLVGCNNQPINQVTPAMFNQAITFQNHKSLSYTIVGDLPSKHFVDEVEIDNNKSHIVMHDSELSNIIEQFTEKTDNEEAYLYKKVNDVWTRVSEPDGKTHNMFQPQYYFKDCKYDDFIFVNNVGRYIAYKTYTIDSYRVRNIKFRFENNRLIDAEFLLMNSGAIEHVMNYTYTYKSVSITLPKIQ